MTQHTHTQHRIGYRLVLACSMMALLIVGSASAQTTVFSYQGKLTDNGTPANGQYDFQFKLFDTATVGIGTQQGSTIPVSNVTVTEGTFTVQLDFGASVFPGAPRFLEMAVKKTSDSTFTTLGPRQPVASNPYAIHTLNADGLSVACVSCITSSQIQSVQGSQVAGNISGSQISGAIPVASVPAGSASYIQNGTSQQAATSFNISGNGTIGGNLNVSGALSLNIVNAQTQFNLSGNRVLGAPGTSNLFAGINAGAGNTSGDSNSFFGANSGQSNTTGVASTFIGSNAGKNNTVSFNTFVGSSSGLNNTTGGANSFFGQGAGLFNTSGSFNSFFGTNAGHGNATGQQNAFFGNDAGFNNTTEHDNTFIGKGAGQNNGTNDTSGSANFNTFVGSSAGLNNTTGGANAFFGSQAGKSNTFGGRNSFFGFSAGELSTGSCCNSFFGAFAGSVNTSGIFNTFVGSSSGERNTTGEDNVFIGDAAGSSNTTGSDNAFFGRFAGASNTAAFGNTFIGTGAGFDFLAMNPTGDRNTLLGAVSKVDSGVNHSTAIGADAVVSTSNTIVLGTSSETVRIPGNLNVTGSKNFKIDHPLDPENKYLYHAAIESSEVLNLYSGNVTTDANGDAVVKLPDWFEAINRDFRYQLTVIGSFAQAIVARKVSHNHFTIKTSAPNVEVSWQVTGIRSDAGLLKHPFKLEEDKPESERGRYLNPEGFGQPEEKSVEWIGSPERIERLKQQRAEAVRTRNKSQR